MKPAITEADYRKAAGRLGCDVPAIKAVASVEATGSGFLTDERPKVLFEAHVFSGLTGHRYDRSHPDISKRRWAGPGSYGPGGAHQHRRMELACSLDRPAGLQSASWGLFQIMGYHWDELVYPSLQAFINAMYRGEPDHLDSFVRYVLAYGLAGHLRAHRWAAFANGYNGPQWAENDYAGKMARAYRRFGGT